MNSQGCEKRAAIHKKVRLSKAFTLIELLVVIAIIALLLSVLLPALRKAKEAAYSVVCRAHLRGAGMGVITYVTNYENWLPGPNTSGLSAAVGHIPVLSTDPVQNVDWVSPTLGDQLGLASGSTKRLESMFNTEMKCPANKVKYDYAYPTAIPGLDPQDLYYSSYSAALIHHMVSANTTFQGKTVTDYELYTQQNAIKISEAYRPKQDRIGTPGRKIWAMDGARYYDLSKGTSFNNLPYQNDGGNFMICGPIYPLSGDPYMFDIPDKGNPGTWKLREVAEQLAYRHNKRINVVFLDGHCETLGFLESLVPSYYLPKDSQITSTGAGLMISPNVGPGYIR